MIRKSYTRRFLGLSLALHTLAFLLLMKIIIVPPKPDGAGGIELEMIKIYQPLPTERKLPEVQQPQKEREDAQLPAPPQLVSAALSIDFQPISRGQRAAIKSARVTPTRPTTVSNAPMNMASGPDMQAQVITTTADIQRNERAIEISAPTGQSMDTLIAIKGLPDAVPTIAGGGALRSGFPRAQGWLMNAYAATDNIDGGEGVSNGRFRKLMTDIARGISATARSRKIDVVFIIDTTGSMCDNVRGIRAYTDTFLERLQRDRFDVALGLVTFSDRKTARARGVTTDFGKFKNWFYHTEFTGGGDLTEAGLDAIMTAIEKINYRWRAQKFFIMATDGPFHDADYDGRSPYSLDQVIDKLKTSHIQVDMIGLDYLPVKQISWATGGQWRQIPGAGYLEQVAMPLPAKIYSQLGVLSKGQDALTDDIIVQLSTPPPEWVKLSWKVLNPYGEKCLGGADTKTISPNNPDSIHFSPTIDLNELRSSPGTYTFIYRIENSQGNRSILRRTIYLNSSSIRK